MTLEAERQRMHALARTLDDLFNPGLHGEQRTTGFALLVFPLDTDDFTQQVNYVCNAQREDMVKAMRAWIEEAQARGASGPVQ